MQGKLPLISVNGVIGQQISPLDRGFAYGDGVFETCRIDNGQIPLWPLHRQRLLASCDRLFIPLQETLLEQYVQLLLAQMPAQELVAATLKIIVTRGEGGRGYRLPDKVQPTLCIGIFPAAHYPEHYASRGVTVRLCQQRLGCNPALAGLKHLNRLEHILARAEWCDEAIAEGLLLDGNDHLIEATISNLFIVKNATLLTPDLSEAGVAGVMRRFILESLVPQLGLRAGIKKLTLDDLLSADEVFLSNSVFGIWPVAELLGDSPRNFFHGEITRKLQALL
ncbi:MAG TPA: aminodeoxychorismate lyase [Cellvibrio sp.]|nr:aminodeoxychorismate lyase [Cellvibrio sp.]